MGILASLTSGLIAFNPTSVDVNSEEDMLEAIVILLAKFPILCAWTHRKVRGLPLNYANTSLSYIENVAHMMFKKPHQDYTPNPIVVNALNKLLILHADHEQNCSTSTVRWQGHHMLVCLLLYRQAFQHFGVLCMEVQSGCY